MSAFVDGVMIELSDSKHLQALVFPPGDETRARIRQLFSAVYALPAAGVHDVVAVDVLDIRFQYPLRAPRRWNGTWNRTSPTPERADLSGEYADGAPSGWLDVTARLALTVVLEVDPGEVESIELGDLGTVTSLADFRSRFRHFDLDAFLAEEHIGTVEELRSAYRYMLGRVRLKRPGPFDPNDAKNRHRFDLDLGVHINDVIDLVGSLRAIRAAQGAAERGLAWRRNIGEAQVRTPYAPVLVLPAADLGDAGHTRADIEAFYAAQDVLAIFAEPF